MKVSKKSKAKSDGVLIQKSEAVMAPDINLNPYDTLAVKVLSLRLSDDDTKFFAIKITFFDQLLVHSIISSIGPKVEESTDAIASGTMNYDPADYEKMCLIADAPLVVHIQPLKSLSDSAAQNILTTHETRSQSDMTNVVSPAKGSAISSCNVDILSIFLGLEEKQTMCVKKRMEPMIKPSMMYRKSWDTLPLITMELTVDRHAANVEHHKVLKEANWMKLTLIASYNMFIPFENEYVYTAASKTPLYGDSNVGLVTFNQGYREPRRFDCTNFYPKWESLRVGGELFTRSDQKLECKLEDIQNDANIDLPYYLKRIVPYHTAVWGSFHRTLMLKNCDKWLWKHLRDYKWPLEVHIYGESGGYSFMAFLNLFQLLYPGEKTVRLAVPLQWINGPSMMKECGCDLMLTSNDRPPSTADGRIPSPTPINMPVKASKSSKVTSESIATSSTFTTGQWKPTGADDNDAFVLVEVRLGRPLKAIVKPPRILKDELMMMLIEMETELPHKRICTGRGQLERDWQKTIRSAAASLRKVPYYGTTEFCTFNRQLSETRTRVELTTSCWQDAAIYINNNFVVQKYLHSDEVFEELVMMAHACLMKSAGNVLVTADICKDVDPTVRAARHARQMQDTNHAMELYLRAVVEQPRNASFWRELSTCLKDIDRDWAIVCLNKAVVLDPRNPLTLLSKGGMLFEENPEAAEPFFMALLTFFPTWSVVWTIASAYFYERELFHLADKILDFAIKCRNERITNENDYGRYWERELGDWWDSTPILPGMNLYFDATDLLLRLRAIPLAEVCLARVLAETGESAAYYHLVGLCCRLRGEYTEALCHLNTGLQKFGEINYLRSLEAECHHGLGNINDAIESIEKAGCCVGPFSILMSLAGGDMQRARNVLVDLARRQPSAYAWTALAEDWVMKMSTGEALREGEKERNRAHDKQQARSYAVASAMQALKLDRRAGRAWALLGRLVIPKARRTHCFNMAAMCGWEVSEEEINKINSTSQVSLCHLVGTTVRECRCNMCDKMRL